MKRAWFAVLLAVCLSLVGCGSDEAESGPLTLMATADDYKGTLQISSALVGPNTFTWSVTDAQNHPLSAGEATIHFSMAGTMDHSESDLELTNAQDGTWTGEGPNLMMDGIWLLQLKWTDEQGKEHIFDYTVTAKIE